MKKKYVAIRNQADSSTLQIYFLDIIEDSYDWFFDEQTSKVQEIIDKVNFYKPSKIICMIDSVGGNAQIGLSIYNFLKAYNAKIEVEIIGLAGSIAAVLSQAANKGKLRIARNGFMMIHQAEGICMGKAEDIRQYADLVDMYTDQCVDIFSQRTAKSADDIKALIANGDYWMTGQQAVEQGFADETFNDVPVELNIAARLDTSVYKNLPPAIKALVDGHENKDDDTKSFFENKLDEMKKYFTAIIAKLKGHKVETDKPITDQLAEVLQEPFEKIGEEMEGEIDKKVEASLKTDAVKTQITNVVSEQIGKIDFAKEGPAKTALDAAVKTAVENATKDYTSKITALETDNTELKNKNIALTNDITALKGKKNVTNEKADEGEVKAIGKWNN